ncbi:MAG: hypothetical protein ABL888_06685 [Pirellulaceae bacterium]
MAVKKTASKPKSSSPKKNVDPLMEQLQKSLNKMAKADLIDTVILLAKNEPDIRDAFVNQLDVQIPLPPANKANLNALIAKTREAIAKATWFDHRQINHNFDFDYRAYESVQRLLNQLVAAKHFEPALELAVELMKKGSYQIEMSDEGMMLEDVQDSLRPVAMGLNQSGLPQAQIELWLERIRAADSCGFVWSNDLLRPKKGR